MSDVFDAETDCRPGVLYVFDTRGRGRELGYDDPDWCEVFRFTRYGKDSQGWPEPMGTMVWSLVLDDTEQGETRYNKRFVRPLDPIFIGMIWARVMNLVSLYEREVLAPARACEGEDHP